jgi:large subunit ribosomal protein L25
MAEIAELEVELRDIGTKGAVRALRRAGRIPAVVYGQGETSQSISLDGRTLALELERGGFMNRLYDLKIAGKKQRTLPRDVQFHVVTDRPIHVDFLRLSDDTELHIEVPVVFLNEEECPGISRGGILNVVRHEIEVVCRAAAIPEHIDVDLTGWDIGDSIHISAVTLPEGVRPTITDRDFTIATIAAPTLQVEEAEVEEGAEGEAPEGEAEAADEESESTEEE